MNIFGTGGKNADPIQLFVRALLFISVAFGIAYYISQNLDIIGEDRVALDIVAPRTLALTPDGDTSFEITLTLTNRTGGPVDIRVVDPCKVFRWLLLTTTGDLVHSKATDENCSPLVLDAVLEKGATTTETFTITLLRGRVVPGDYLLRVQFWGYEETAAIEITP
jgi:hypothetical protein